MLVVISPAKKLDWTRGAQPGLSVPDYQADATALAAQARKLGAKGLAKLMDISPKLADLNLERFDAFQPDPQNADPRAAIHAFAGDTYTGLDAASLDADALDWANGHLRILSGLYGLLRPMDALQPYRLEMGSRLKTARGRDLYAWWGPRIAQKLRDLAAQSGTDTLVNCASQEYFGAVDQAALGLRVITPVFLDSQGDDTPRVISFHAKRARGAMARFMLEQRLTNPDGLTDFQTGGYRHAPDLSAPDKPAFLRVTPA